MADPFDESRALITGGAGDIGRAVAHRLIAADWDVVIADLDLTSAKQLAEDLGPKATAVHLDLASPDSIARTAWAVQGTVSAVIHCAGLAIVEPFLVSSVDHWDAMLQVNLRGPMLLTKHLLPGLLETDSARVVFVSSDGARAGAGGEAAYAASKSGLFGFAKSLAREVARHQVTVNVVCPGPIEGQMVSQTMRRHRGNLAAIEKTIPMKRLGRPEEVATLIAWLASPEASYITGQLISVSGGITMS
ncbi:SDR family NAD(P)-dependent oxidoreductase [Nocardia otitidiscaviarum]|uniref:SDR family NAD(P)-dependent oxidoreductase n=1 Tax=Nocardia otitidiscaviarum TaxID=1823 RepID=UPI001895C9CB|nr:SDR family NAD(P)-dependent oxidoreductase [Nocardia otitidiscaviarum]MBF6180270.1 SDR family oxidoreductase [Nocardia otitidiscaviarum]